MSEDPEAQVAHHARDHSRDQVVVGEVAERVKQEEPDHGRDQERGQRGVVGQDGVVEEGPEQKWLEGDEGGRRRLREHDEEGLAPVRPEVARRRLQEVKHSDGGSYAFRAAFCSATQASIRASRTSRGRAPLPRTRSWKARTAKAGPRAAAARARSSLIFSSPIL